MLLWGFATCPAQHTEQVQHGARASAACSWSDTDRAANKRGAEESCSSFCLLSAHLYRRSSGHAEVGRPTDGGDTARRSCSAIPTRHPSPPRRRAAPRPGPGRAPPNSAAPPRGEGAARRLRANGGRRRGPSRAVPPGGAAAVRGWVAARDRSGGSRIAAMEGGYLRPFAHFGTQAIHAGQEPEQWRSGALVPPVSLSTTFKQQAPGEHAVSAGGAEMRLRVDPRRAPRRGLRAEGAAVAVAALSPGGAISSAAPGRTDGRTGCPLPGAGWEPGAGLHAGSMQHLCARLGVLQRVGHPGLTPVCHRGSC